MTTQCEECGRFCRPVDSGQYFGGACSWEPPDTSYFCQECVDKKIADPYSVIISCWWIKPDYVSVAKSIIRHYKNH